MVSTKLDLGQLFEAPGVTFLMTYPIKNNEVVVEFRVLSEHAGSWLRRPELLGRAIETAACDADAVYYRFVLPADAVKDID